MEPLLVSPVKYPPQVAFYNKALDDLRRGGVPKMLKIEPEIAQFLFNFLGFFAPGGLICGVLWGVVGCCGLF